MSGNLLVFLHDARDIGRNDIKLLKFDGGDPPFSIMLVLTKPIFHTNRLVFAKNSSSSVPLLHSTEVPKLMAKFVSEPLLNLGLDKSLLICLNFVDTKNVWGMFLEIPNESFLFDDGSDTINVPAGDQYFTFRVWDFAISKLCRVTTGCCGHSFCREFLVHG